jgi:hypothetical protein
MKNRVVNELMQKSIVLHSAVGWLLHPTLLSLDFASVRCLLPPCYLCHYPLNPWLVVALRATAPPLCFGVPLVSVPPAIVPIPCSVVLLFASALAMDCIFGWSYLLRGNQGRFL